jgi:hypothetical protein
MPAGDRTGPRGIGPRSGRAAGYCAGFEMPGYANPGFGRGFGVGFGRGPGFGGRGVGGRGWRHRSYATGRPGWLRFGGYAAPYREYIPFWRSRRQARSRGLNRNSTPSKSAWTKSNPKRCNNAGPRLEAELFVVSRTAAIMGTVGIGSNRGRYRFASVNRTRHCDFES